MKASSIASALALAMLVPSSSFGFEGGYMTYGTFRRTDLPEGGRHLEPLREGALHFYLPRAHEMFEVEGGLKFGSSKRKRHFSSSGLFYSKDGEEWSYGGEGLHFTEVWTHPKTGRYFGVVGGVEYESKGGRLFKRITYHVVASEDGSGWRSIHGDLVTGSFARRQPSFFADPDHEGRACLYFHAEDRGGFRWSIAQAKDESYTAWRFFTPRSWPHGRPDLDGR